MALYKLEYWYRIENTKALDPHIQLNLKELQLNAEEFSYQVNTKIIAPSIH